MALEASLWHWLKKARLILRDALHIERVENSVGAGRPDVDGFLDGQGQFLIELKSEKRPVKPATPIRFKVRESQIEWHKKRRLAGGHSFFLVQLFDVSDGPVDRVARYLVEGIHARALLDGMPEHELRSLSVLDSPQATQLEILMAACR